MLFSLESLKRLMSLELFFDVKARSRQAKKFNLELISHLKEKGMNEPLIQIRDKLLSKHYPHPNTTDLLKTLLASESYSVGFKNLGEVITTDQCNSLAKILNKDIDEKQTYTQELINIMKGKGILKDILDTAYKNTGILHIIWSVTPLIKRPDTKLVSDTWHFDNHYCNWIPKLIIYLNEQKSNEGATELICREQSIKFSRSTNYIGLISQRPHFKKYVSSYLKNHSSIDKIIDSARFCPSTQGQGIIFYPSQSLHRGIAPKTGIRNALAFSLIPVFQIKDVNIESALKMSLSILEFPLKRQLSLSNVRCDAIPFYKIG